MLNIVTLFDCIIIRAQEARDHYVNGLEIDAFEKLDEIQRAINTLQVFKEHCESMANQLTGCPTPSTTPETRQWSAKRKPDVPAEVSDGSAPSHKKSRPSPAQNHISLPSPLPDSSKGPAVQANPSPAASHLHDIALLSGGEGSGPSEYSSSSASSTATTTPTTATPSHALSSSTNGGGGVNAAPNPGSRTPGSSFVPILPVAIAAAAAAESQQRQSHSGGHSHHSPAPSNTFIPYQPERGDHHQHPHQQQLQHHPAASNRNPHARNHQAAMAAAVSVAAATSASTVGHPGHQQHHHQQHHHQPSSNHHHTSLTSDSTNPPTHLTLANNTSGLVHNNYANLSGYSKSTLHLEQQPGGGSNKNAMLGGAGMVNNNSSAAALASMMPGPVPRQQQITHASMKGSLSSSAAAPSSVPGVSTTTKNTSGHSGGAMVSHLGVANQNTSSPVTAVAARNHTPNHHLNSSQNQTQSALSPEQVQRVDEIFFNFLQRICSDLNATDAKGETIHQTLMAKKMQKLEQTPDYRPFRFRIQAFTNAFQEELRRHGLSEEEIGIRKVKQYLWGQRHISRFNDDGNKSKSKGNHVWNVEAKKLPTGVWTFWQFSRRITPAPPKAIRIGSHFEWAPKVWDPQIQHPKVIFSSPGLPPWLNWADNVLSGVPGMDAQSFELKVNVQYCEKDIVPGRLEEKFTIMVTNSMDPNGGGGVAMNMSDFQLP